jgi:hypothetical protein
MRQGQQNRRGRGRGRKGGGQNPLSRSYESNGPDVKIRGTAHHIAEKYMSLARDAASSGDQVMAENYLQHAEHYNRIIMAAQAQLRAEDPAAAQRMRRSEYDPTAPGGENGFDGGEDEFDDGVEGDYTDQPAMAPQRAFDPARSAEQPRLFDAPSGGPQPHREPREPREPRGEPREPRERTHDHPRQGAGGASDRGGFRRRGGRGEQPNRPRPQNVPTSPAEIAALAAANGNGYAEGGERRRPAPERAVEPGTDED